MHRRALGRIPIEFYRLEHKQFRKQAQLAIIVAYFEAYEEASLLVVRPKD